MFLVTKIKNGEEIILGTAFTEEYAERMIVGSETDDYAKEVMERNVVFDEEELDRRINNVDYKIEAI